MRRMGFDMSRTKEAYNEAMERFKELQLLEMRAAARVIVEAELVVAGFPNDSRIDLLRDAVAKMNTARNAELAQMKILGERLSDGV